MGQRLVRQGSADAKWTRFLKHEEEQRLNVLNERIDRAATRIEVEIAERQRIMARAAARMRRARP